MTVHGLLEDGDRYELLGELASGGMATVYLARMRRPMGFSRLVAIKCMHPQFAKDPSFVSMFMDEARLTARLRHPNIVPTLDIVNEAGHLLLVMEYVEGASLANVLRTARAAGAKVPPPIALGIVHDLLLGLHEAHEAKDDDGAPLAIVHRDVSPQNVLVGLDGLARVLDFGVARARQNTHRSNDNEIKGKIPYMPPEQLFGEELDHRVDVYAAGVTLWEALVCERLFDGPSETALVKKISEDPIPAPSSRNVGISPAIDAVVMRALARNANDRFPSALAMAEAIAAVMPLPTRTEISAWVRQYVSPREVPSGNKLPAAAPEAEPITTMLAILERASMLRPASKRSQVQQLATPVTNPPLAPSRRRSRIVIGVAALAFALAGIGIANVAIARSSGPAAPVMAVSTPPQKQVSPSAPEVTPPTASTASTASTPPTASTASTASTAAAVAAPTVRAASAPLPVTRATPRVAVKVSAPAEKLEAKDAKGENAAAEKAAGESKPATGSGKPASCNIPYTIDSAGHKHYKVECI